MKTILLLSTLFLANTTFIAPTTVYLCNSKTGKKYHLSSTCRGLSTCQAKIVKTTLDKAKAQGKTLCGWED